MTYHILSYTGILTLSYDVHYPRSYINQIVVSRNNCDQLILVYIPQACQQMVKHFMQYMIDSELMGLWIRSSVFSSMLALSSKIIQIAVIVSFRRMIIIYSLYFLVLFIFQCVIFHIIPQD